MIRRSRNRIARSTIDRIDVLMVLLFLLLVAPWVNTMTAQPAARYLLTAAVVEEGTVTLDGYEQWLGIDRIETDDHVYSDKAPLQPLLGVPVLAAAQALGLAGVADQGTVGNTGLWTQTFVFAAVPGAMLLPLMRRQARRHTSDRAAIAAAMSLGFGTMLLVFSGNLYAHVLVAFGTLLAWHIVSGTHWSPAARAAFGGLAMGLSCAAEYPVFAAAAVVGVWVLVNRGVVSAAIFSIPSVCAGLSMFAWNLAVYGTASPSYSQKAGGTDAMFNPPRLHNIFEIFLGGRGFILTPIVLLSLGALLFGLYRRLPDMAVPTGIFLVVFLLQAGWGNPWGGEGPGPRYMLLAIPMLSYPLATVITGISRSLIVLLTGVGTVSMGLALVTLELVPKYEVLIETHIRYIRVFGLNPTLFSLSLGTAGWLVHTLLVVLTGGSLLWTLRSPSPRGTAVRVRPAPSLA